MRKLLILLAFLLTACTPNSCASDLPPVEAWVWCGVHPDDPYAEEIARSLAIDSGIAATMGPCMPPDWSAYTTAHPGDRYVSPEVYYRLVELNARYGMKTLVYDARVWDEDPAVVDEAIRFWSPVIHHVEAWDMGDEFDPLWAEQWDYLVSRWTRMMDGVTNLTGVWPYTNHMGFHHVLDRALQDIPRQHLHLSFDLYDVPQSLATAERYSPLVQELTCAVNGLDHGPHVVVPSVLEQAMIDHREAGCTRLVIFGGVKPYNTPGFNSPSLVYADGTPTVLAGAVYNGSR